MRYASATAALLCCASCVDFGVPPTEVADSGLAEVDDGGLEFADAGACVEESVDPALAENTINLVRFTVDPLEISIAAGSIVAISNNDNRNHRMLSGTPEAPIEPTQGGFNTGVLAPGESYGHRFCEPRTLLYYCSTHPGVMNGYRIVVE